MGLLFSCNEGVEYGNVNLIERFDPVDIEILKSNPEKFNSDTLRISGRVFIQMGNVSISNDEFSIWINNFEPAVKVDFADNSYRKLNEKNVELIGIYKSGKSGNLSLYDGKFTKILYIKTD